MALGHRHRADGLDEDTVLEQALAVLEELEEADDVGQRGVLEQADEETHVGGDGDAQRLRQHDEPHGLPGAETHRLCRLDLALGDRLQPAAYDLGEAERSLVVVLADAWVVDRDSDQPRRWSALIADLWERSSLAMAALAREEGAARGWTLVGYSGVVAGFLILSFYSVIAGWALAYVLEAVSGGFQGLTGETAGAAFGSGASSTVFGARGSASFLSRATGAMAAAFFLAEPGFVLGFKKIHERLLSVNIGTAGLFTYLFMNYI